MRFAYINSSWKRRENEQSTPFKTILDDDRKKCHVHWIPHATLQSPKESSFITLFESGDDQALITLTALDHVTVQELPNLFAPTFSAFTPFSLFAGGSYL